MLSIIVAVANHRAIGKDNRIPWYLPEDLKRFKQITSGHTIIMGRKTFESIGKILPNRKHVIVTKEPIDTKSSQIETVKNIEELEPYISSCEECFIIGGESIYRQLLPFVSRIYLTKIYVTVDADTYFPVLSKKIWKIVKKEKGITNQQNPYSYYYLIYERKDEKSKK